MVKSGGANLLKRKYFYGEKLKSYGAPLKSGGAAAPCIAPPFPPPMNVTDCSINMLRYMTVLSDLFL